jgi:hypothetical protein
MKHQNIISIKGARASSLEPFMGIHTCTCNGVYLVNLRNHLVLSVQCSRSWVGALYQT